MRAGRGEVVDAVPVGALIFGYSNRHDPRPHAVTWEMNQTDIYRKAIQRTFAESRGIAEASRCSAQE
jgi:hypothetical protein